MLALKIDHHGPAAEHQVGDVPRPTPGPVDMLVEVQAAAINPSDLVSAEGRFPNSPLPRILGRDFAGRIVEGPPDLIGKDVWGSGGDLGISRDGTHAEYLVIPKEAASIRPANLTAEQATASGLPFVTAWSALIDRGGLAPGEWVIVSGPAGAVGGAAVQIASAIGAKVIALVKDDTEDARVDRAKIAAIAHSDKGDLADVVKAATGGNGADLAINGVGAPIFQSLLDALAKRGRMVVFSAVAGREVTLDLFALYRGIHSLYGLDTSVIDVVQGARILDRLAPLFETRAISPPRVDLRYPLSKAPEAYQKLAGGKVVLVPDRLYGA